jgi:hypothetical protein
MPTNRRGASLNVVDVHSGAVWAAEGPLAVDTDSWTLVLWSLQDRGLRWNRVVMDEGAPMHSACRTATPPRARATRPVASLAQLCSEPGAA